MVAFNKKEEPFNSEDEGILTMLAKHIGLQMRNCEKVSEFEHQNVRSKRIIQSGVSCMKSKTLPDLTRTVEQYFKDLLSISSIRLCVVDEQSSQFVHHLSRDEAERMPLNKGIMGRCFKTVLKDVSIKPQENENYCLEVDLNSSLPLVTLPIVSDDDSKVLAVVQFHHPNSFFYHEDFNRSFFELDMVEALISIVQFSLQSLIK